MAISVNLQSTTRAIEGVLAEKLAQYDVDVPKLVIDGITHRRG